MIQKRFAFLLAVLLCAGSANRAFAVKPIFITGVNRGLGLHLCRIAARNNLPIIVSSRRESDTVALLKREGIPFLPSSDVVEAALTLAKNPRIDALIHTHASTLFTRNPSYAHRRLVPKLPYGEPLLGHRIATVIGDHLNDFIILEDHGEFFNFSMAGDLARPAAQVEAFAAESLRVAESLLSAP